MPTRHNNKQKALYFNFSNLSESKIYVAKIIGAITFAAGGRSFHKNEKTESAYLPGVIVTHCFTVFTSVAV